MRRLAVEGTDTLQLKVTMSCGGYLEYDVSIEADRSKPWCDVEHGRHVSLKEGARYSIVLRNSSPVSADAVVTIDGNHLGKWRVERESTTHIDYDRNGRELIFTSVHSSISRGLGIRQNEESGLIKVVFYPEVQYRRLGGYSNGYPYYRDEYDGGYSNRYSDGYSRASPRSSPTRRSIAPMSAMATESFRPTAKASMPSRMSPSRSAGVTVAGRDTHQRYGSVDSIRDVDDEKITTVYIRLDILNPHDLHTGRETPYPHSYF